MHEQFARAERVGHHHGHRRGQRARRDLRHHRGLRDRGKAQAAVLLGNEHGEELVVADVLPALLGNILELVHDFPLVEHLAERFRFVIQKRLLLGGELGALEIEQVLPVRLAAEHLGFPPGAAGFQRFALGVRHRRQHGLEALEDRGGDQLLAQARAVEDHQNRCEHQRGNDHAYPADRADCGQQAEVDDHGRAPDRQGRADIGQRPGSRYGDQNGN